MNLFVTGCAGFIGSNFIKWLLQKDSSVKITHLDALTYAGNLESIQEVLNHPRHQFIKGNICDSRLTDELVAQADLVINFAAESHVDRSIYGPKQFIDTNINGTFNLLESVRKQKRPLRFVQVSTDEVYGSLGPTGYFTEETPLSPNSPYSASKTSADLLVRSYHHTYQMDVITTRCSNNYGPYQFPEKLIPLVIQRALKNESIPVYGDGKNIRDWIFVNDHCEGVWLAATQGKSGEVYNFGASHELENIQIVKTILKTLDRPDSLITYVKDRPGHDRRYAIDSTKSRKELNWKPAHNFDEAISYTIDWYQKNQKWVQSVISGEYQSFYNRWYQSRV